MTSSSTPSAGGWPMIAGRVAALAVLGATLSGCVGVAAPSQGAAPGYGYTCYAGVYVCRLPQQIPAGTQCSCPGIGAPSFGTVR